MSYKSDKINSRTIFNKVFGCKSAKLPEKKKPIVHSIYEYPIRPNSLGKSSGSEQGVAGWKWKYYRKDWK